MPRTFRNNKRTNERTNEHTNGRTEKRKLHTRRHKCRGGGGIIILIYTVLNYYFAHEMTSSKHLETGNTSNEIIKVNSKKKQNEIPRADISVLNINNLYVLGINLGHSITQVCTMHFTIRHGSYHRP